MKVVFCSAEVFPFAKVGGLADVCGALPLALEKKGLDVSVIMPLYQSINLQDYGIQKVNKGFAKTTIGENVPVYFLENGDYFGREGIYGDRQGGYHDNLNRFQSYTEEVLTLLKELDLKADILHCHDWHAALIPVYLKFKYQDDPFYKQTKSILTIHNLAYQGVFPKEDFEILNLPEALFGNQGFEFFDQINLLKAGIIFSDRVSTVSPQYAKEIQTEELGCGLDGVLKSRSDAISGILNGLDYDVWNPRIDSFLLENYSPEDLSGKMDNKRYLQELAGFSVDKDIPIFGFVGRLASQKGLDLMTQAMDQLAAMDLQMVVLGVGEVKYHQTFEELSLKYGKALKVFLEFDESKAHAIYAGSDFFLMPSHFEPCGLGQLISLKYGTIPLVFKTGGLADTITSYHPQKGRGNGFVFEPYHCDAFLRSVQEAMETFHREEDFQKLIHNAMGCDFSWDRSAQEYQALYQECLSSG